MRIEATLAEMRSAALRRDFIEFDRLSDLVTVNWRAAAEAETADDPWEKYGLTPNEARIMARLARTMGHTVTRTALMDAVYFDCVGDEPDAKIIDIFICKARARLAKCAAPYWIETHWGRGYSLNQGAIPKKHRYAGRNNRHRWHRMGELAA